MEKKKALERKWQRRHWKEKKKKAKQRDRYLGTRQVLTRPKMFRITAADWRVHQTDVRPDGARKGKRRRRRRRRRESSRQEEGTLWCASSGVWCSRQPTTTTTTTTSRKRGKSDPILETSIGNAALHCKPFQDTKSAHKGKQLQMRLLL